MHKKLYLKYMQWRFDNNNNNITDIIRLLTLANLVSVEVESFGPASAKVMSSNLANATLPLCAWA